MPVITNQPFNIIYRGEGDSGNEQQLKQRFSKRPEEQSNCVQIAWCLLLWELNIFYFLSPVFSMIFVNISQLLSVNNPILSE